MRNDDLLNNCRPLKDYMTLINEIRKNCKTMEFESAVDAVVTEGAEIFDKESETPIPHLTYTNRQNVDYGYCSMYKMEDQPLRKIDWHKAQYAFRYGDVLMYSLDGSAKKDYRSYGTH